MMGQWQQQQHSHTSKRTDVINDLCLGSSTIIAMPLSAGECNEISQWSYKRLTRSGFQLEGPVNDGFLSIRKISK
jgi:hypothetical protein